MKAGWQTVELGGIAELRGRIGWKGLTAKEYTQSGPRFLSVHSLNYGDYVDFRDAFHISQERYDESPEIMLQQDDILICKDGAGIGKLGVVPDVSEPTTINSSLLLIRSGPKVLPKFLYFCLLSPYFQRIVQSRLEGATTPHLYQRDIRQFPVFLPPLEEQKRIVAVLDEAFATLDLARTHAETNLKNARELFESYLDGVFAAAGKGWKNATIEECLKVKSGDFLPKKSMDLGGDIPVVGGNGKTGVHNAANLDGTNIVIGRVGAKCGNVHLLQGPVWLTDNAFRVSETKLNFDPEFLAMILRRADLGSTANQAAQPVISYKTIKPVMLSFPTQQSAQSAIVAKANEVQRMTTRLETQYSKNLADVEDLRQSLLQKAFSGELT